MLGVIQYLPGARNLMFHAICLFPENAQVFSPHNGSFLLSHSSLSVTKNNRLNNNKPAKNDIYKNKKFGFFVNANNHKFINNGWKHI
jgi:hypothetical protein